MFDNTEKELGSHNEAAIIESGNESEMVVEKETVVLELEKIDKVRLIVERRYDNYEMLKSFIGHLASTEKVFRLAGIKNFGGDEIMDMFIDSETKVMANKTGIEEDVFNHIREEFSKTHQSLSEISDIANNLREKYSRDFNNNKFIKYLEDHLLMLLEITTEIGKISFDLDKEKEKAIYNIIQEMSEGDNYEAEKLGEIYQEFREALSSENN